MKDKNEIPLEVLADRANTLAIRLEDTRLEFCRLIAELQYRVPKETNYQFMTWAKLHLKKPNGEPWSTWTLYSYASYGRDPQKLAHVRAMVKKHGVQARSALRILRHPGVTQEGQVNALMTAWEAASEPARSQFLHLIGAIIESKRRARLRLPIG